MDDLQKTLTTISSQVGQKIQEGDLRKMQKLVDETYYNLCKMGLYGDIYYELQNLHGLLDDLFEGEYIDEDDLDKIRLFYVNNYN